MLSVGRHTVHKKAGIVCLILTQRAEGVRILTLQELRGLPWAWVVGEKEVVLTWALQSRVE